MASVNRVTIIGNLGQDPEVRYSANGGAICNLSIATSRKWKNKDTGDLTEETEWHRVSLFGKQAEAARDYLQKGRPVYIEGRIKTRKWQDKEGADRWTTEIIGEQMQFLGGREDGGQTQAPRQRQASKEQYEKAKQSPPNFDDMADDVPWDN